MVYASSAIAEPLAIFYTAIMCHEYMPQILRDDVLVPISKINI